VVEVFYVVRDDAVMMQGEFHYEDTVERGGKETGWIFWSGQVLLGMFGLILSLILIDIFLGYTVSDIKVRNTSYMQQYGLCNKIILSVIKSV
jgi:hypothetical protein